MDHIYAVCLLARTGRELNEANIVAVLEAANAEVDRSRVKSIVAALESVQVEVAEEAGRGTSAAQLPLAEETDRVDFEASPSGEDLEHGTGSAGEETTSGEERSASEHGGV